MSYIQILEVFATLFSLIFLFLLIRRDIKCWFFGIISSILSVLLFYEIKLYSESFLYVAYIIFGFYGWYNWKRSLYESGSDTKNKIQIEYSSLKVHLGLIFTGLLFSIALGYYWSTNSNASYPYLDTSTTTFALIATWLETKRYFENWYYWIIVNAATILLYALKDLQLYAILMVIYTFLSVWGWWSWKKSSIMESE